MATSWKFVVIVAALVFLSIIIAGSSIGSEVLANISSLSDEAGIQIGDPNILQSVEGIKVSIIGNERDNSL